MPKTRYPPDDPDQSARFKKAAKEAGLDETGERFEREFKKLIPEKRPSSEKG